MQRALDVVLMWGRGSGKNTAAGGGFTMHMCAIIVAAAAMLSQRNTLKRL